ncbi:hypothetical protein [Patiriisocius sp. Uisw_017]|uniref:hypothetical protein n=1 Tax=Patiriisocius sp. Uisw_017 TaxID=3230968 RepID=UPI0039E8EB3B
MKKMFFCASALLFGATVFAQNTSTLDQVGVLNNALIEQSGVVNISTISQTNDGTTTLGSEVVLRQGMQSGATNPANESTITQTNELNYVRSFQEGDGNTSVILQTTLGTASPFDASGYLQGVDLFQIGQNNASDVLQTGDNQGAVLNQFGGNNIIELEQLGELQLTFIEQVNGDTDSQGNAAIVAQNTGLGNIVDMYQENDGNFSSVSQTGEFNTSVSTQVADFTVVSAGNIGGYVQGSIVDQTGQNNYTDVFQAGDFQLSTVIQSAAIGGLFTGMGSNEAYVTQNGQSSSSTITQMDGISIDADNYAMVNQTGAIGGLGSISTLTQTGANTATVNQNN